VYLIHKAGKTELLGKDIKEQAQVRQIEGVLSDIRQNLFKAFFGGGDHKAALAKTLEAGGATVTKIDQLSKFLGTKEYLLGHLTYADFLLVYTASFVGVAAISLGLDSPFCKHENIKQHAHRITDLPAIKPVVEKRKAVPYMPPTMMPFPLLTCADVEAKKCH